MQKVVLTRYLCAWIGKKCKRVTGFLAQIARFFGVINADGYRANTGSFKLTQLLFYAS
jgi:hypothetical protein